MDFYGKSVVLYPLDLCLINSMVRVYLVGYLGLTLIGMSYENKKKCSSLAPPRGNFYDYLDFQKNQGGAIYVTHCNSTSAETLL